MSHTTSSHYRKPAVPLAPHPETGSYWVGTQTGVPVNGNGNLFADFLYAIPMVVDWTVYVDAISMRVAVAGPGGAHVQVGIYSDNGRGYPGWLLRDAGDLTAASTGFHDVGLGLNLEMYPGLYWMALNSAQSAGKIYTTDLDGFWPIVGQVSGTMNRVGQIYRALAHGPLPLEWGAGGTYDDTSDPYRLMLKVI